MKDTAPDTDKQDVGPIVHYSVGDRGAVACGRNSGIVFWTTHPAKVTCPDCRRKAKGACR